MIFVEDIMDWIADNLNYTVEIDNITDNTDGTYTIEMCDTFILRTGKTIEIDGDKYKIEEFQINNYILIKPVVSGTTLDLTIDSFEVYPIGVQSGVIFDATKERTSKRKTRNNIVPFVWNRHPKELVQNWEDESTLFGTAQLEWYLLDETNIRDYTVKDDNREVIQPMYNLLGRIKKLLRENEQYFNEVTGRVRTTPYKALGVQTEKGSNQRIFAENLSGIKVEFELEILEDAECCKGGTGLNGSTSSTASGSI